MVRSKRNEVEKRVLKVAKDSFLNYGFKDSSIRKISAKAGISKSSMYTYFDNKDALFSKIVKNTVLYIEMNIDKMKNPENYPIETYGFKYHIDMIDEVADFVDLHRDNLNLLIFKSEGSSYENFFDKTIDCYTGLSMFQTKYFIDKIQCKKKYISKFLIHTIVSCYGNFVKEVLMHDIPLIQMKEYGKELMTIFYHGSKVLFDWDDRWDDI